MGDEVSGISGEEPVLCAVASSDGFLVDQHFGRAKSFDVYEVGQEGEPRFVESRKVQRPCSGQGHSNEALDAVVRTLGDCAFVIVARVGPGARAALSQRGIEAYEIVAEAEAAIEKVRAFRKALALTNIFEEE